MKNDETHFRNRYAELVRLVKKNTRAAKRNHEIRAVNEARNGPNAFFKMYWTKQGR